MHGFWLECRRVMAIRGLRRGAVAVGSVAGVDAHDGLPLDIVNALGTACFVMAVIVMLLLLLRRVPAMRRRLDRQARIRRSGEEK
jgi:hypothetical protein